MDTMKRKSYLTYTRIKLYINRGKKVILIIQSGYSALEF